MRFKWRNAKAGTIGNVPGGRAVGMALYMAVILTPFAAALSQSDVATPSGAAASPTPPAEQTAPETRSVTPLNAQANLEVQSSATPTLRDALRAQVEQIQSLRRRILAKDEEIRNAASDELRSTLVAERRDLERQLDDARFELLNVLSDVDLSPIQTTEDTPFTLQGSVEDLLKPLIQEVKKATESSRERRELEDRYDEAERQAAMFERALSAINSALETTEAETVRTELQALLSEYSEQYEREKNQLSVLGYRLDQLEEKKSFVGETSGIIAAFFRERGRNLLFAILAAAVGALGIRILHGYLHNHSSIFQKGRSTAARILDVGLYVSTFVVALIAAVVVLLAVGDWVLMGLVVLILFALILTAKDTVPGYIDELRMILNMGPVKEGERIVYNGIPWLVENLTFFTILRNPVLRGGIVRMPIAQLQGMLSRPTTPDEPFFPSEEGDWVLLDDGTYGEVIFQSAEMVRLRLLGGALRMYPTGEYLEQNPQNNSHGFRIVATFGVDYDHQRDVTGSILDKLNSFYRDAIARIVPAEQVRSLKVEFAAAGMSSLDYQVLLDLTGDAAPRLNPLSRALQRIGVDACNTYGLTIPFQQVTVHQAEANVEQARESRGTG